MELIFVMEKSIDRCDDNYEIPINTVYLFVSSAVIINLYDFKILQIRTPRSSYSS